MLFTRHQSPYYVYDLQITFIVTGQYMFSVITLNTVDWQRFETNAQHNWHNCNTTKQNHDIYKR